MIDELHVKNLALIRNATLEPARGLTALTGETGAGKTALLASCRLLMGQRADKTLVREGEAEACVQGRLYVPWMLLTLDSDDMGESEPEENAIQTERELVATRRITADGRSRVQIDGEMASVAELAEAIAPSIDLCGQHDQQALLKPSEHVHLLDKWAGNDELVEAYKSAYAAHAEAKAEVERVREGSAATEAQLEQARFVLRQIEAVDPKEGEYEELSSSLKKAENSESLVRAANTAYEALSAEGGALDGLNAAIDALDGVASYDSKLSDGANALREAAYVLEDVSRDARAYRDSVEFDPETLVQMQDRVGAYQGLMRTYGPTVEDILKTAEDARNKVEMVDDFQELEKHALEALTEAESQLRAAAEQLSEKRQQAAPAFADAVTKQMQRLAMGSAELGVVVQKLPEDEWMQNGPNQVEFVFSPAQNMQARPLARIASGGELSRVMLAVHVVMGASDTASTLVFDEIDAGVGGATALALAEVLAELAETHQVIVVTHLAQVATRAAKHYIVRKSESDGTAETELLEVEGTDRENEIARMLAGSITETSLAHARELLNH